MILIGKLQGGVLVLCAIVLALVCFVGGFAAAAYLGHMEQGAAVAVAGSVLQQSEMARRGRSETLNRMRSAVQNPVFAASRIASRPVQNAYRRLPAQLTPVSPARAIDQAILSNTQNAASSVGAAPAALLQRGEQAAAQAAGGGPPGTTPAGDGAAAPVAEGAGAVPAPVVAAEPPPPPPQRTIAPPPPPGGRLYVIQLASFLREAQAMEYVAEMQRRQIPVAIVTETDASGREWRHIRVGPFTTAAAAELRLMELRRNDGLFGVVTTEPVQPERRA